LKFGDQVENSLHAKVLVRIRLYIRHIFLILLKVTCSDPIRSPSPRLPEIPCKNQFL
uniref:Ovule protein n=1 Tax=Ascaris lumbricoides TaxID=6252 RepID=A0A0M3IQT7_ASCLU